MTTNDPYEAPRPYPQPHADESPADPAEQRYTPAPATEWPAQWAPAVQHYPGTTAYAPGTYGQSYSSDETYGPTTSYGSYGETSYGENSYRENSYRETSYAQSPYGTTAYGQFGPGFPQHGVQFGGGDQFTGGDRFTGGDPGRQAPTRRRGNGLLLGLAAAVVAAALVIAGIGFSTGSSSTTSGSGSALQGPQLQVPSDTPSGGSGSTGNGGALPNGGSPNIGGSKTTATATQQVGIVTIVSVLTYQSAESAGTGMILSPDGEVLTNNHVVNGATSITVTVESSGRSYKADVVGTAPTKDVAVLKLRNASGLQTANLADTAQDVQVGDAIVGVGNAGGTGTLTQAAGKVTGLDKSITATDESGAEAERLTGLIEVDAPIISGDSGGPLYDSDGKIIGIDTAASTNRQTGAASTAYAIRIDDALGIAQQIESGVQTTTIHIGLPAFVGFSLKDQNGSVIVPLPGVNGTTIVPNGPADDVGIEPGSTITALGGTKVASAAQIKTILAAKNPGDRISISWTGVDGKSRSATLTLTTGPAD